MLLKGLSETTLLNGPISKTAMVTELSWKLIMHLHARLCLLLRALHWPRGGALREHFDTSFSYHGDHLTMIHNVLTHFDISPRNTDQKLGESLL